MQCSFVAATLQWDSKKDGPNPLVAAAVALSIDGTEQGDMSGKGQESVRGIQPEPLPDTMVVENGFMMAVPVNTEAPTSEGADAPGEPVRGSFEGLAQMFGPAGAPR